VARVPLAGARARRVVARGEGRNFGPALTEALDRLSARVDRVRKRRARARKGGGGAGGPAAKTAPRRKLARA